MTQQEVAYKLQVSERTISYWESGASSPPPRNLKALCELFEVKPSIFRFSDSEFYNYITRHIHPAEFPLVIRELFNLFWELKELPAGERALKQCSIFDRLMPLMYQGHIANLDEPTEAQLSDEELIRNASPYD